MSAIINGIGNYFGELFTPIIDILKSICFFFDNIIYSFIPRLYALIVYLANVDFINNSIINSLVSRIYVLVGIFMLFKLSFSFLNYIIDPSSFTDQGKGVGNLVKKILIALILLVSVPFIFSKIYDFQGLILKSNIIPRLILGTDATNDVESTIASSARDVQFLVFGPFFSVNYNIDALKSCAPSNAHPMANIIGTLDMAQAESGGDRCIEKFDEELQKKITSTGNGAQLGSFFRVGAQGYDHRDFSAFGTLISWNIDGQKVISYQPIISTLVGGYLVFLLLSFCIDVAARAIKLVFYQMLSPVAIISSIVPSGGDQNSKLRDWATDCLKVYTSLFIRLAIIFLVVQVVKMITEALASPASLYYDSSLQNNGTMNVFVYLFLILGAFQVASKLPEMIEKAFGFKLSGELNLNPFKALSSNAGFMGLTGAATGVAAGVGAGALAGFTTSRNLEKGPLRSTMSGLGGAFSGAFGGALGGLRAKGLKGLSAGSQVGGRISRRMEVREATGGIKGVPGMALERIRRTTGMQTEYETMENQAKRYDEVRDGVSKMREHIVGELGKGGGQKGQDWLAIQASRKQVEADLEKGVLTPGDYAKWQTRLAEQENQLIASYNDDSAKGTEIDAELEALRSATRKAMKDAHMTGDADSWDYLAGKPKDASGNPLLDKDGKEVKNIKSQANARALGIRSSEEYNDARDRSEAIKLTEHDSFFGGPRGK